MRKPDVQAVVHYMYAIDNWIRLQMSAVKSAIYNMFLKEHHSYLSVGHADLGGLSANGECI